METVLGLTIVIMAFLLLIVLARFAGIIAKRERYEAMLMLLCGLLTILNGLAVLIEKQRFGLTHAAWELLAAQIIWLALGLSLFPVVLKKIRSRNTVL